MHRTQRIGNAKLTYRSATNCTRHLTKFRLVPLGIMASDCYYHVNSRPSNWCFTWKDEVIMTDQEHACKFHMEQCKAKKPLALPPARCRECVRGHAYPPQNPKRREDSRMSQRSHICPFTLAASHRTGPVQLRKLITSNPETARAHKFAIRNSYLFAKQHHHFTSSRVKSSKQYADHDAPCQRDTRTELQLREPLWKFMSPWWTCQPLYAYQWL